jgi:ABC-type transport system involved in multi-copper enzyme maturation permease subunit
MRSQVLPLLRNEIIKASRRRLPYFGVLVVAVLSVIIYAVAGQLSNAATANAWGYIAFSMQLIFTDIGLIFLVVFSALLLAEETGTGTIRAALAAPVYRWELFLAKAAMGLCYMIFLSLAALFFSGLLGKIHYDFGAVTDSLGTVYSRAQIFGDFLLAFALSWIPLVALVTYGLFIATVVRSPGTTVAVSISTLYLIDFTKHLVGLDPYIFTKYTGYSWQIMQQAAQGVDYQWQPEVWKMIGLSAAYALATFGAGLAIFVRQDLND